MRKGQRTQLAIIEKAIELFAKHGYDQTSFQMIADACKVSQAAALFHFKNKFGLFEAVALHCATAFEQFNRGAPLVPDPSENVRKYLRDYATWLSIKPNQGQVMFLLYYFASYERRFAELYADVQKRMRSR